MSGKPQKPKPSEALNALRELLLPSEVDRVEGVLTEMLVLFYPPFRAEDEIELLQQVTMLLRAYVEDLCEFSPEVLREGWKGVRRAHRVERWPTIQSMRDACLAVAAGPSRPVRRIDEHQRRMQVYRQSGFWSSSWGMPPDDPEARERNQKRFLESLTPIQLAQHQDIGRMLKEGRSAASILREITADQPGNQMPLLPSERMDNRSAARARSRSLESTGEFEEPWQE